MHDCMWQLNRRGGVRGKRGGGAQHPVAWLRLHMAQRRPCWRGRARAVCIGLVPAGRRQASRGWLFATPGLLLQLRSWLLWRRWGAPAWGVSRGWLCCPRSHAHALYYGLERRATPHVIRGSTFQPPLIYIRPSVVLCVGVVVHSSDACGQLAASAARGRTSCPPSAAAAASDGSLSRQQQRCNQTETRNTNTPLEDSDRGPAGSPRPAQIWRHWSIQPRSLISRLPGGWAGGLGAQLAGLHDQGHANAQQDHHQAQPAGGGGGAAGRLVRGGDGQRAASGRGRRARQARWFRPLLGRARPPADARCSDRARHACGTSSSRRGGGGRAGGRGWGAHHAIRPLAPSL
jgi:hypothetical protein